jgi:hypothetical protein
MFAKARVFDAADDTENLQVWTGNIEVKFREMVATGETDTRRNFKSSWDGGDDGFADPNKKGVISKQGKTVEPVEYNIVRKKYTKGRRLATIKLQYCSTVGLISAGIFGHMLLARRMNEYKRGAALVAAEAENMPPPKKVRCVPEIDGHPVGLPIEYELFDLTTMDEEKDE